MGNANSVTTKDVNDIITKRLGHYITREQLDARTRTILQALGKTLAAVVVAVEGFTDAKDTDELHERMAEIASDWEPGLDRLECYEALIIQAMTLELDALTDC